MITQPPTTVAALASLVIASVGYADMTPVFAAAYVHRQREDASAQRTAPRLDTPGLSECQSLRQLGQMRFGPWWETGLPGGQVSGVETTDVISDEQSSSVLCPYSFLGLGLCKSAARMKTMHSFEAIRPLYHDSGFSQVGHSLGFSRAGVCPTPIYFVQPEAWGERAYRIAATIRSCACRASDGLLQPRWPRAPRYPGWQV
jgi:hypothetical protein